MIHVDGTVDPLRDAEIISERPHHHNTRCCCGVLFDGGMRCDLFVMVDILRHGITASRLSTSRKAGRKVQEGQESVERGTGRA